MRSVMLETEIMRFLLSVIRNALSKRFRHSLGEKVEKSVLELLSMLIYSKNAPKALKSAYLIKAQTELEMLVLKLRLLLEMELVNETKVFQMQADFQEIGKMIGGWMKSL